MKTIKNFFLFWASLGNISYEVFRSLRKRPFYYKQMVNHIYDFGYRSLSTVLILGISTGGVLTLHIGKSIEKYGAKLYVPRVLALAIFGEFAPVLTSIILAGRVGSGITSEIGTMKVTEQIDAMRALGVSPIKRVITPRVLACLIIIPVLCLFTGVIAILTGAYVGATTLHLDPTRFIAQSLYTPRLDFFLFSVFKTFVFSFFIVMTACHYGLGVQKGSSEVGKASMKSIVASFLLITIGDLLLTKFYYSVLF